MSTHTRVLQVLLERQSPSPLLLVWRAEQVHETEPGEDEEHNQKHVVRVQVLDAAEIVDLMCRRAAPNMDTTSLCIIVVLEESDTSIIVRAGEHNDECSNFK